MSRNIAAACCASLFVVVGMTLILSGTPADTRVADAAMKNDPEAVRALIKQAVDVNMSQGDGMTALHWAALNANAEIAQMLVQAGANVKAATRLGAYTPLFMAAKSGATPVIDILLKAGANANSPAVDGITPLMMAASADNPEAVRRLIEAGADVNATETERGQTPLIFAASFNAPDAIQVLLKNGAAIDQKSKPLAPAVRAPQGQVQRGQGQQGQQTQQGQRGQQAQQSSQAQQDSTRSGGNPRGELTPLMHAAIRGNFNAVRALLEGGAQIDEVSADHSTALLLATINGSFDVAKYLVERGADVTIPSVEGATPLYAIVSTQWAPQTDIPQPSTKYEKVPYLELMKLEMDRGANPNARLKKDVWYTANKESTNDAGTTPFWKCASVGDMDGMRLLIDRGANPNIPNVDGITPLLVAAGAGYHGNNEMTAPYGRMAAVKYLVEELGADVNAADTAEGGPRNDTLNTSRAAGGFTPLHNAAARGDNAMILYLISKGARADAVSRNGTTVVDMANGPRQRIQPYPDTVALLEMLGSTNSHKCVSC
jgi:ankyrin repeat protein